jgi:hypothetical protein
MDKINKFKLKVNILPAECQFSSRKPVGARNHQAVNG